MMPRKKGSKNRDYGGVVHEIPAKCTACQGTDLLRLPGAAVRRMKYDGKLGDGTQYTHVEWRKVRCGDCGQFLTKKTYSSESIRKPNTNNGDTPKPAGDSATI
jgi:hypothetical protein